MEMDFNLSFVCPLQKNANTKAQTKKSLKPRPSRMQFERQNSGFQEAATRDKNKIFLHHKTYPIWHYLERHNEQLTFSFLSERCTHYKGYFLCQKSLIIPEQMEMTPSSCSLVVFSLRVPELVLTWVSYNTPRVLNAHETCTTTAPWALHGSHPEWRKIKAKAVSAHRGGSWFFTEDIDLKGLKQTIETFNNIIPEVVLEPKKIKASSCTFCCGRCSSPLDMDMITRLVRVRLPISRWSVQVLRISVSSHLRYYVSSMSFPLRGMIWGLAASPVIAVTWPQM